MRHTPEHIIITYKKEADTKRDFIAAGKGTLKKCPDCNGGVVEVTGLVAKTEESQNFRFFECIDGTVGGASGEVEEIDNCRSYFHTRKLIQRNDDVVRKGPRFIEPEHAEILAAVGKSRKDLPQNYY
jgi:hypothetical protein